MTNDKSETWHYTLKGERLGPVLETALIEMIKEGKLSQDSKVWRNGMPDWVSIRESEISIDWDGPPPLDGSSLKNSYVWFVAFSPIIGLFIEYVFGIIEYGDPALGALAVATGKYWYVTLSLNIGGCLGDQAYLKKAGHSDKTFDFWIFLVPIYLFKRAKKYNTGSGYAWTWIAMFALSIVLSSV